MRELCDKFVIIPFLHREQLSVDLCEFAKENFDNCLVADYNQDFLNSLELVISVVADFANGNWEFFVLDSWMGNDRFARKKNKLGVRHEFVLVCVPLGAQLYAWRVLEICRPFHGLIF